MTSASKEPSSREDHPDSQGGESEENQLDLFEILPRVRTGTPPRAAAGGNDLAGSLFMEMRPAGAHVLEPHIVAPHLTGLPAGDHGSPQDADLAASHIAGPATVETIGGPAAARDFPGAKITDSEDLRRLEESIRWLMNAGTSPLPRAAAAPLRPVIGLSPLDPRDEESLLLDPDTLFPPRAPRRSGNIAAGAAKILLVSAIAAPTAYFVASWLQFPEAGATSDTAAVATAAAPGTRLGVQVASLTSSSPIAVLSPAAPPMAHDAVEAPLSSQPLRAAAPLPAARSAETVVAALATPPAAPAVAAPAADAKPSAEPAGSAQMSSTLPAKPTLRQEEIALMVERGRLLFEAGDLAAARLFFRRAANAGDAAAAIAMGATYDPEVLTQRFIRGIEADAQEAQRWYERAREMGRRVEMLAQRR